LGKQGGATMRNSNDPNTSILQQHIEVIKKNKLVYEEEAERVRSGSAVGLGVTFFNTATSDGQSYLRKLEDAITSVSRRISTLEKLLSHQSITPEDKDHLLLMPAINACQTTKMLAQQHVVKTCPSP